MRKKDPAAVRLGKLRAASMTPEEWKAHGEKYGSEGGLASAAALTVKQRSERAKKAAEARWAKAKKGGKKKAE